MLNTLPQSQELPYLHYTSSFTEVNPQRHWNPEINMNVIIFSGKVNELKLQKNTIIDV